MNPGPAISAAATPGISAIRGAKDSAITRGANWAAFANARAILVA